jgi:hypothetical protein
MSVYLPEPLVYLFVGGALCIPTAVIWSGFMTIFKAEFTRHEGKYNPLSNALCSVFATAVTFGFFYWIGKLVLQRLL